MLVAYTRLRIKAEADTAKMTSAEIKRLKLKTEKSVNETKAEKAAHKVLRYRKHLDAQIKSASNFTLFDNLLQCTIVIDTKVRQKTSQPQDWLTRFPRFPFS